MNLDRLGAGPGEVEAAERYLEAREAARLARRALWLHDLALSLQEAFDAPARPVGQVSSQMDLSEGNGTNRY